MTKAIVAAVQRPSVADAEFDASLAELRQLAKTLGFEVVGTFTQKRAGFDAGAYFGTGKREELKKEVEEKGVDLTLIRWMLSLSISERLDFLEGSIDFAAQVRERNGVDSVSPDSSEVR